MKPSLSSSVAWEVVTAFADCVRKLVIQSQSGQCPLRSVSKMHFASAFYGSRTSCYSGRGISDWLASSTAESTEQNVCLSPFLTPTSLGNLCVNYRGREVGCVGKEGTGDDGILNREGGGATGIR
eukprot:Sspe_Gene.92306::Locus_64309_Transcript_1_1_Confidence_1.000_Length_710::g.92306::m.92306